jgi:hypothetical protein
MMRQFYRWYVRQHPAPAQQSPHVLVTLHGYESRGFSTYRVLEQWALFFPGQLPVVPDEAFVAEAIRRTTGAKWNPGRFRLVRRKLRRPLPVPTQHVVEVRANAPGDAELASVPVAD